MNPTKEQLQDPQWWQDNAPEGATHFHPDHNRASWCWVKVNDHGSFYSYYTPEDPWEQWDTASEVSSNFVKRPTDAGWDGEGLPPVGEKVEAAIPHVSGENNEVKSIIWVEGSVIAYFECGGKTYSWFESEGGFYPPDVLEFRLPRTPEQIAAEERTKTIDDMVKALGMENAGTAEYIRCGLIYDAGYRDSTEVLAALEDLAKAYRQAVVLDGAYDEALHKAESLLSK